MLNNSDIVEILLYVYMPFYNGDISQTDLYLETTGVLQSIIDEYAAVSPIHIMGDLNVRLHSKNRLVETTNKLVDMCLTKTVG